MLSDAVARHNFNRWINAGPASQMMGPMLKRHRLKVSCLLGILDSWAGPDSSFSPVVARNSVRMCIYSAPSCSNVWSMQCCLW